MSFADTREAPDYDASTQPPDPACDAAHALSPLLDASIARFIKERPERLTSLVDHYGSPLNIVWPHTVGHNLGAMTKVLTKHIVDHDIFYGAKVNKSPALVRAAVAAGAGIDASSLYEFEAALRAGASPSRICATGPAKPAQFHRALVAAGALIAVDSIEELADLAAMIGDAQQARILLRYRPRSEGNSRFGMDRDALAEGLRRVAACPDRFKCEGFHTHLGGYAVESRIEAMNELAAFIPAARELGLTPRMIDIGGGMPIRYVAPDAYARVLNRQCAADYRNAKIPASFYPYGSEKKAGDWIETLLSAPCRGTSIADFIKASSLCLALEPGRSVVDQAAITVFRITRVKPLDGETAVIFVEGSSFSACETWCASEFMVDPILLPSPNRERNRMVRRAYIAGHSCLEDDIVTNRLLDFAIPPQSGDLLIYGNTAGYQMDLLENEFHRHPMPTRLVADLSAHAEPIFFEDK